MSIPFRIPPAASIACTTPRRSMVGVALACMKCVQVRLYALGSARLSSSATLSPPRANSVAAVQPAILAPTIATSYSGRVMRMSSLGCTAAVAGRAAIPATAAVQPSEDIRMTRPEYDVAIVGASIAGCTAATLFARGGLRVALLESRADPNAYKRTCTHFIQASATPTIERLGVVQAIEAAGGIRNGIDIWTRWGWIRREGNGGGRYPGYGYNIRRETLDPMLRRLAASTPGVDLLPGHVAERLFVD